MKLFQNIAAAAFLLVASCVSALASQGTACMPTSGTLSGLTLVQDINAANKAFVTMNSGASAPATDCSGLAQFGQMWLDTSTSAVRFYDGANWIPFGFVDATNHVWMPPIGGGVNTIASASTTDVCSLPASVLTISGTTTINSLGSSCSPGNMKVIKFSGALVLTNSANLVLPTGQNVVTTPGDFAMGAYLGAGVWAITTYTRADGSSLKNAAIDVATIIWSDRADPTSKDVYGFGQALARASYPDYLAAVTRTQSAVRTNGNATLTGISDTSGMGVGMPIEGNGIQIGTTIASVTSSTIVMSLGANSSGTSNATVFFTGYGSGGSTSTVGVKDCRGRVIAGRDDMGGTAANRLTASYFGAAATALGAAGGNENTVMAAANIYLHSHGVFLNDPGHAHNYSGGTSNTTLQPGGANIPFPTATTQTTTSSTTNITVRSASGGGGTPNQTADFGSATPTPMRTVQPTVITNCFVRVLP